MQVQEFLLILEKLEHHPLLQRAPVSEMPHVRGDAPFVVLVATLLSARTKDEVTIKAVRNLFRRVPDARGLAQMEPKEIADLIYPVGFYRTKARHLHSLARALIDRFHGQVPNTLEELMSLPGVGRKTANLVLAEAFGMPAICVDIHVQRICYRMGITNGRTPMETEKQLMDKVPEIYWRSINRILVALGQTLCRPRSPLCGECPALEWCERRGL